MYSHKIVEATKRSQKMTMNHTCLRVKDPAKSVKFYTENFGMQLLSHKKFPEMKFDLYFLGFQDPESPKDESNVFSKSGILELTHNYGTESDPEYQINNGNVEPHRGFGHLAFTCYDIAAECARLESLGVEFKKRLVDGRQKDIAFVYDPDHYWIELVCYGNRAAHVEEGEPKVTTDLGYKFNHTMIRVKDPKRTAEFYTNVLGMSLLETKHHENAKFSVYFFGYKDDGKEDNSFEITPKDKTPRRTREGLVEATHNWGTENDPEFQYHNGNDQPQGFGHICVSCTDPQSFCEEITSTYSESEIKWGLKFNMGKMKNIAFVKDPDNYSIEIVPHNIVV